MCGSNIRQIRIVRLTGKQLMFCFLVILLTLIPALTFEPLNYVDELLGLFSALIIFKKIKFAQRNRLTNRILLCLSCVVSLGFISNLTSGIETNLFAVMVDCFGVVKNHIIFIATVICLSNDSKEKIFRTLHPIAVAMVYICLVCGCINIIAPTLWTYDVRYGINSFKFFYSNPAALGQMMMIALAIFDNREKRINLHKIAAMAVMVLTLRSGVMAIVLVYFTVSFILNHTNKIHWYHVLLIGIGAFIVGYGMIKEYFLSRNTLRYTLLHYGIIVSNRFFPLGSGFATYGSQMAYSYYSPLYYEFGFNNVWGLNQTYGGMVNDNFWPMILAQIGVIGAIAQFIMLISEFQIVNTQYRKNTNRRMTLVLFFNLLISTIGSANLTGVAGTLMYFTLGLMINSDMKMAEKHRSNSYLEKYLNA